MPTDDNNAINNYLPSPQWPQLKNGGEISNGNTQGLIFDFNNKNFDWRQVLNKYTMPSMSGIFKNLKANEELKPEFICEPDALYTAPPVLSEPFVQPHEFNIINSLKILNCKEYYPKNFNVTKDLFNGSAEDLNKCLKGTKLEGMGQIFLDTQNKYGINAIFLIAISGVESNYGRKPQKNSFSIFGTGDRTSKSYAECLDKLGNNLKQNYIKRNKLVTIEKINKKYAPSNPKWAGEITKHMKSISKQIMSDYQ